MNFQVNLQGIIDLLSKHLYSEPGVFIRELLQNSVDAVTSRKRLGQPFNEVIKVEIFSSDTISISDEGCGLTENEIEQFLARIGSSIKREEQDHADDYIGQFGVGLLSCFVVSDEIVMITKSANDGIGLEWRGKPDGTYSINQVKRKVPIGTTVFLKAKAEYEEYFEYYRVRELLQKYGEFLPTPIEIIDEDYSAVINERRSPWHLDSEEAMSYVEELIYSKPMDVIPLTSIVGGVQGIAYILPYAVSLQDEKRHRVYLKNMLLSDKMQNILPPWAFFVNAIINTDSLKPTASREAFQENDLFFIVRNELGDCIKKYLIELATSNEELFERIVRVHYASFKTMAVEDDELYELLIQHLSFETSYGDMKMSDILKAHSSILVSSSVDEFRQISRVAKAQELMIINGGYVNDLDLVRKLPDVNDSVSVEVLDILAFANRFTLLDEEEREYAQSFIEYSNHLLEGYQCRSLIRFFEPADIPVLYNTSQEVNFFRLMEESESQSSPLFQEIIGVIKEEMYEKPYAQLCYNFNNPIVRKAIAATDKELRKASIELFYTQALLLGNHVMGTAELKMMNDALLRFMNSGFNEKEEVPL